MLKLPFPSVTLLLSSALALGATLAIFYYDSGIDLTAAFDGKWIATPSPDSPSAFLSFTARMRISEEEREVFLFLLRSLVQVCAEASVPYFLTSGTLLGAYRIGDILPWDDDVDVVIAAEHSEAFVLEANAQAHLGLRAFVWHQDVVKLYSPKLSTQKLKHKKWDWPFIDVFLYYEDWVPARPSPGGKKLYHLSPRVVTETATEGKAEKGFKGDSVFPLSTVQFMGLDLAAPRDIRKHLVATLGEDVFHMCKTNVYDHRHEVEFEPPGFFFSVPCESIVKDLFGDDATFNI